MFVRIIIGLIILAVFILAISFFLKKRNQTLIDELEEKKLALMDIPVVDAINQIKQLNLTGQSLHTFDSWKKKWDKISIVSFPDLESMIFEAEESGSRFQFLKAKAVINKANDFIKEMEESIYDIQDALKELIEDEESNRLEIKKVQDVYQQIRKKLLTQSFSFGPALENLENRLSLIEESFTKFSELTASGDHIEAKEVLEQIEKDTKDLDIDAQKIPDLYKDLTVVFPEQLEELQQGYEHLLAEHYVFLDENIDKKIIDLQKQLKKNLGLLEKFELVETAEENRAVSSDVDALYVVMEKELEAKQKVNKKVYEVEEFLKHAAESNHRLLIELDRISQSYTLNHGEMTYAYDFKEEIESFIDTFSHYQKDMENHKVPYSVVEEFYNQAEKRLEEIEKRQAEINQDVQQLRKEELAARSQLEGFEYEIRSIKRFVEKQRLPGIPRSYTDVFFTAANEVENLAQALNQVKIDVEEIRKMIFNCQEKLDHLKDETNDLIDSALLTEQMLQYANRYRHTHEEIAQAMESSLKLFSQKYQYRDALEVIATVLEKIEPGAFKKVEHAYYDEHQILK